MVYAPASRPPLPAVGSLGVDAPSLETPQPVPGWLSERTGADTGKPVPRPSPRAAFAVLLLAGLGYAPLAGAEAPPTGTIAGLVLDDDGRSVGGATVTVSSPELPGGPRSADTDEEGAFTFEALPPLTYVVDVEKEGFPSFRRRDVVVVVGKTVRLDVEVPAGAAPDAAGPPLDAGDPSGVPVGRWIDAVPDLVPGIVSQPAPPAAEGPEPAEGAPPAKPRCRHRNRAPT